MRIRKANVEDSEALARIQVDSYRTAYAEIFPQSYLDHFTYQEQEQDWRGLLTSGRQSELFVAETAADGIAGYVLGRAGPSEVPPYDGEIVALHVRQGDQGRGIGRQLIATIAKQLSRKGCTSLMVWVLESNPARGMYEGLGGEKIGEKAWDGNEEFGSEVKEVAYGWLRIDALVQPG